MTKNMKDETVTDEAVTLQDRNYRKIRQGYVVSDKMDKTVVVEVEDRVKHALYGKVIRRSSKVKAHDEDNAAGIGDRVRSWRPARSRPPSAGAWWRSSRRPSKPISVRRPAATEHRCRGHGHPHSSARLTASENQHDDRS